MKKTIDVERRRITVRILGIPLFVMQWTETIDVPQATTEKAVKK